MNRWAPSAPNMLLCRPDERHHSSSQSTSQTDSNQLTQPRRHSRLGRAAIVPAAPQPPRPRRWNGPVSDGICRRRLMKLTGDGRLSRVGQSRPGPARQLRDEVGAAATGGGERTRSHGLEVLGLV